MNVLFDSSGKNPFLIPPLPQSYYIPSPSKEVPDKGIVLTPQKVKHRYEYALPPEVYTPEQYSIVEDETASFKPPLPSRGYDKDIVRDLQYYLNDVDTWTSSQFCEQWPSKNSNANEESTLQGFDNSTAMSAAKPLKSTTRSNIKFKATEPTAKDKRTRIKTSFASARNISADSDRTSSIQMRLNRFRYGDPKPPEERERQSTVLPTPSATASVQTLTPSSRQEYKSSQLSNRKVSTPRQDASRKERNESVLSKYSRISTTDFYCPVTSPKSVDTEPKPPIPPKIQDSPEPAERSISALSTRLDRLLRESTSLMSSPPTSSPSLHTSTEKSSLEFIVSSSNDTTKSSELEMSRLQSQEGIQNVDGELPRRMLWQKENLRPADCPPSPQKIRREDDILYNWRLKRKLEIARDSVEKNTGPSFQPSISPCTPWHRDEPEKPLVTRTSEVHPQLSCIYSPQMPVYQPQNPIYQPHATPRHPPFQHQPSCNCQTPPQIPYLYASTAEDAATYPTPPQYSMPKSEAKHIAIGMPEMVSSETQTGQSLMFMDDDATSDDRTTKEHLKRSVSLNSFPHSSTPASSVSFHKVKIVEADVENSPQTNRGSPQVRNMSSMSGKTEATTLWSSTDQNKKIDDGRSPVSSVKTTDARFASDSDTLSPTAGVVKEIIGSRLFNTTQTPSPTSAISRLKEKKKGKRTRAEKPTMVDLNGSYTSTDHSTMKSEHSSETSGHPSVTSSQKGVDAGATSGTSEESQSFEVAAPSPSCGASSEPVQNAKACQEKPSASLLGVQSRNETEKSDFDLEEMLDKLLEDIANDPGDFADDVVLQTLRSQRDQFLQEFRLVQEQIENLPSSEDDESDE